MKFIKIILAAASALVMGQAYSESLSKNEVIDAIERAISQGYGRDDLFSHAPANIPIDPSMKIANFVKQNEPSLMPVVQALIDLESELTGQIYTVSKLLPKPNAAEKLFDYLDEIKTILGKLKQLKISSKTTLGEKKVSDAPAVLEYYRDQLIGVARKAIKQLSDKLNRAKSKGKVS